MQICGNANVWKCKIKTKTKIVLAPGLDLAHGMPG